MHLWYIPFILMVIAISTVLKRVSTPSAVGYLSAIVAGLILVTVPIWRPESMEAAPPIGQYVQAAAPVFIGIFCGVQERLRFGRLLIVILIALMIYVVTLPFPGVGLPYLIGVFGLIVAIATRRWNFVQHHALEEISQCTFGVYIIHPIFLMLLHLIGQRGVISVISAFFLSTVTVLFTRRHATTVSEFIF
ncbi:MAG: acyltransferase family protein [Methylocella sp.]